MKTDTNTIIRSFDEVIRILKEHPRTGIKQWRLEAVITEVDTKLFKLHVVRWDTRPDGEYLVTAPGFTALFGKK